VAPGSNRSPVVDFFMWRMSFFSPSELADTPSHFLSFFTRIGRRVPFFTDGCLTIPPSPQTCAGQFPPSRQVSVHAPYLHFCHGFVFVQPVLTGRGVSLHVPLVPPCSPSPLFSLRATSTCPRPSFLISAYPRVYVVYLSTHQIGCLKNPHPGWLLNLVFLLLVHPPSLIA